MYFTGQFNTFEQRLHSLPTGSGDLNYFRSEDDSYVFPSGLAQHINREYQKKYFLFTRNPSYATGWYLTPAAPSFSFNYESGVAINTVVFSQVISEINSFEGVSINNLQFVNYIDEPSINPGVSVNNIQFVIIKDEP